LHFGALHRRLPASSNAFVVWLHGQNVFVDPANEIVIAQFSSQPEPLNAKKEINTMSMVKAIIAELTA
jgi:hypothetical protein